MSGLQSIPVKVESPSDGAYSTDNLRPLLREIEQALDRLVEHAEETVIDLGSMPFSDRDERELRARLGQGEVSATVDAFGPTLVQETAFPGVWLVEHQDAEQRRLTLHLEIARVPTILAAPEADLPDSLAALRDVNRNSFDTPTEDVQ